jgi:glycosyltransferase involved in cell wall biosynthesis
MIPEVLYITFNRLSYTKQTLPLLFERTKVPFKLTIWDNGSTDGTVEYLEQLKDKHQIRRIMFNKINMGITPVTNMFWNSVETEVVGKIDNDTEVCENWLEKLMEYIETKERDLGAVSLPFWHLEECRLLEENENMYDKFILPYNNQRLLHVPHVGGACYLIKKKVINELYPMTNKSGSLKGGWTQFQWDLSAKGYKHGYVYPLIGNNVRHLDDFRYKECIHQDLQSIKKDLSTFRNWEFNHAFSVICRKPLKKKWFSMDNGKVALIAETIHENKKEST